MFLFSLLTCVSAGQIRVLSALREVVSLTSIGRQMDVKAKNYYRLLGPHQLAV